MAGAGRECAWWPRVGRRGIACRAPSASPQPVAWCGTPPGGAMKVSRPVSGLASLERSPSQAGACWRELFQKTLPAQWRLLPGRKGLDRSALAYRCGGSQGLVAMGSPRTLFPFHPRCRGHLLGYYGPECYFLERRPPGGAAATVVPLLCRCFTFAAYTDTYSEPAHSPGPWWNTRSATGSPSRRCSVTMRSMFSEVTL